MKRWTRRRRSVGRAAAAVAFALLLFSLSGCPTVDGLYGEAYSRYMSRDEGRALELLAAIIEKDLRYTPAYVLEAAIYEARGDWGKSEEALRLAQRAAPPSPVVCFNLGNVLFRRGEYRKAVDEYSRALALNPSFPAAFLNRGNAYLGLKDYESALKDYETFLSRTEKEYPNVRELVKLLRQDLKKDASPAVPAVP